MVRITSGSDENDQAWGLLRYVRLFVGYDYKGVLCFERYNRRLGVKGVEIVYFSHMQKTSGAQICVAIVRAAGK